MQTVQPPDMGFTFLPRPPPDRPGKRNRAAADIDGEHSCLQKKKRRLRLFLITSPLSPQFSHPATNIVDRGSSRIAVWAKQKALGRNLLRKAAILNRIRRQTIAAGGRDGDYGQSPEEQEKEQEQLQMAKLEFDHGAVDTYTRPVHATTHWIPPTSTTGTSENVAISNSIPNPSRSSKSPSPTSSPEAVPEDDSCSRYRSPNEAYAYSPPRTQIPRKDYMPLPPSPLGLSNYDAFDVDDGLSDTYSRFDDSGEDEPFPNSYHDDDDDSVPFSPIAATATRASRTVQTPPPLLNINFDFLDANTYVHGDYDSINDHTHAIWPRTPTSLAPASTLKLSPGSSSPNFPVLSTPLYASSRRTGSPNFEPGLFNSPSLSASPVTVSTYTSPNCAPAMGTGGVEFHERLEEHRHEYEYSAAVEQRGEYAGSQARMKYRRIDGWREEWM